MLKIIFVFTAAVVIVKCSFFGKDAKIQADIVYFRHCTDNKDTPIKLYLTTQKYNRTSLGISMNSTLVEPFDHNYKLDFEIQRWGDGGWKANFIRFKKDNACLSFHVVLGSIWTTILKKAGAKPSCPLQPGFYHFEDYSVNLANTPLTISPGKYLIKSLTIKDNKVATCIIAEINFEQYSPTLHVNEAGKNAITKADLKYVRHCTDNIDNLIKMYITTHKYNRTSVGINMNTTLVEPFDNSYNMDFEVQRWGDGGWKENYIRIQKDNACLNTHLILGPIWNFILIKAGAKGSCPVMPGFYHFNDYNINMDKAPLVITGGRYLVRSITTKNNKIASCVQFEITYDEVFD